MEYDYLRQLSLLLVSLKTSKHLAQVWAFAESFQCDFLILINRDDLLLFSNELLRLTWPLSIESSSLRTLSISACNDEILLVTPSDPVRDDSLLLQVPSLNDSFLVSDEKKPMPNLAAIAFCYLILRFAIIKLKANGYHISELNLGIWEYSHRQEMHI